MTMRNRHQLFHHTILKLYKARWKSHHPRPRRAAGIIEQTGRSINFFRCGGYCVCTCLVEHFRILHCWKLSKVSDAGSKRPRLMDSNPFFPVARAGSFYQPYGSYSGGTSSINSFPVVRLRGLPFNCDDPDIYKFFAGLDVVDCLLVNKNGRFSGEALAVFSSPMQAEFALQRDRQNMGRRYIEVFRCKKQDYYNAIAAEVNYGGVFYNEHHNGPSPDRRKKSSVNKDEMEYTEILKLRGLPYSVSKSDIVEFFGEEFEVTEDNVHIALRPDGKATGEAYAEFASAEVAKKAMCKDMKMIGSRYLELFPSTPEEARRAESRFRL